MDLPLAGNRMAMLEVYLQILEYSMVEVPITDKISTFGHDLGQSKAKQIFSEVH